jgi:hypothetical protein
MQISFICIRSRGVGVVVLDEQDRAGCPQVSPAAAEDLADHQSTQSRL